MVKNNPSIQRSDYPHFLSIPTRWMDNDVYQHVNNVVYYSFFDTVINQYLMVAGGLDYQHGELIGFAVESHCQFLRPISFPDVIDAGLRVAHVGNSSVRYEIGIFRQHEDEASAFGYFVHVFVNRVSGKPTSISDPIRAALEKLRVLSD
ncbi:MAG TPA: thioesterase family protein [Aggregatilineales bacterium]|nr:thioesterase family protein [Aggregatilineales bacterium]